MKHKISTNTEVTDYEIRNEKINKLVVNNSFKQQVFSLRSPQSKERIEFLYFRTKKFLSRTSIKHENAFSTLLYILQTSVKVD